MDDFDLALDNALALAREKYPEASPQKHAAFANAVAFAVTGQCGGYGGPSVREHAAWRVCREMSFEDAVQTLIVEDGVIFGPITDLHRHCWKFEPCHDDDPDDVRILNGE